MNSINLSKKEFEYCTYDAGYMSYLIAKLMHEYETFKYDVIPMHRIGISSYVLNPRTNQLINKRNVEVKELTKLDFMLNGDFSKAFLRYKHTFLPPTELKERSTGITHGIDDDVLTRYPYIQEFIDFIYGCRIRLKDDIVFVDGLEQLLNKFLMYKYYEVNQYIIDHYKEADETCHIDRATFFKSFEHVVRKYEGATSCENDLKLIKLSEDGKKVVDLLQEFTFFSLRCNFQLTLHAGKFDDKGLAADDYFNKSTLDVQDMILFLSLNSSEALQELKYFKLFLNRLFVISRDRRFLEMEDVQRVLADLSNNHKSSVHTRRF